MNSRPDSKPSILRPLLPAPDSSGRGPYPPPTLPVVKRAQTAAACELCRARRVKCSGDRPECVACVRRQAKCVYDRNADETPAIAVKRKYEELKSHSTPYERVYDAIRSRHAADVDTIVRKIRRGEDVDAIARQLEHGDLLLQSSLTPETRYRYEFPLSSDMPSHLFVESNAYLDSLIYEWTPKLPVHAAASGSAVSPASSRKLPSAESAELYAPYLKPYHAAEIIDSQLSSIVPSKWTSVSSDDVLMRRLFSTFFLQDHDWWALFQKDYFLEDMCKMSNQLCSSLLVNAVLALACNYYRGLSNRTEFWNPETLGYRFLAEAKRLWEYEQNMDKLTAIQAALVFHIIYSASGADKIGLAYTAQACAIAHKIGLFAPDSTIEDARLRNAWNYTAWALYSWQSLICFHYFRPPLISKPPPVALPDPKENASWYGESWLKYPLHNTLYPCNAGQVFKVKAEFAIIMNDAGQRLFAGPTPGVPLSAVEVANYYSRFKRWYETLPDALSPRKAVLPSHLKVHMHYFQVIRRLLQSPSVLGEKGTQPPAAITDLFGQPPTQISAHAGASPRHYCDATTCDTAIEDIKEYHDHKDVSGFRSSIILLTKGIYEQGQNFFLGKLVFQVVRAKMDPQDVNFLERLVKMESVGKDQALSLEQVQMEWPVEITSMADDPESRRLGDLVKKLKASRLGESSTENVS